MASTIGTRSNIRTIRTADKGCRVGDIQQSRSRLPELHRTWKVISSQSNRGSRRCGTLQHVMAL
ncbi:MAG: hypothetical protein ACOX5R_09955 [bacterium]